MFNRNFVAAAPHVFGIRLHSPRSPAMSIVELLRCDLRRLSAWRSRRRERKELYEFLASDHRIAADIGYRHQGSE
jgi:uncharacterized protein YjiS (DUF1127 family)